MKKTLLILFFALILNACKNYLSVQPQSYVLPKTDEDFSAIIHKILRDVEGGGDECVVGNMEKILRLEACADNLDARIRVGQNLPVYAGEIVNSMQFKYKDYWELMKDCNIVIENIRGHDSDVARGCLSAAYAIKGLLYYNMIRDYCEPWESGHEGEELGLPIVEKFDIEAMPLRSSLKETVDYCLSQFDKALGLDPSDRLYLFTQWPIKAYKAKLLFWAEDWHACSALCRDILNNSGFELTPSSDYPEMINSETVAKGEVLVKSHTDNSSELDWYFSVLKKYLASRPAASSFVALFGESPEKDVRYSVSIDKRRLNLKAAEAKLRLSEILLMYAESQYHLGNMEEALASVNLLRSKRIEGQSQLTDSDLPQVRKNGLIKEDATGKPLTPLLQLILDERRKELYMEGDRWYELKRNGRPEWWVISNGLKYTTRKYLYTAPISKSDVDMNPKLEQNPGYESK